jgi:hypothetical protein
VELEERAAPEGPVVPEELEAVAGASGRVELEKGFFESNCGAAPQSGAAPIFSVGQAQTLCDIFNFSPCNSQSFVGRGLECF